MLGYGGISGGPPDPPTLQTHTAEPIAATFWELGDLETELVKKVTTINANEEIESEIKTTEKFVWTRDEVRDNRTDARNK